MLYKNFTSDRWQTGVIVKKPELLSPCRVLEKLKVAIHTGQCLYIEWTEFGLRSNAGNFYVEEMAEGRWVAKYGAKLLRKTISLHIIEIWYGLGGYLKRIEKVAYGIIVADPAYHWTVNASAFCWGDLSTQQSLSNSESSTILGKKKVYIVLY